MTQWTTLIRLADGTEVQLLLPAPPNDAEPMVVETTGAEVAS
jgi:hypothetical protein